MCIQRPSDLLEWSYRQLPADLRVLEAEFSPLEEQQAILTSESSLQPRICILNGLEAFSSQLISTVM